MDDNEKVVFTLSEAPARYVGDDYLAERGSRPYLIDVAMTALWDSASKVRSPVNLEKLIASLDEIEEYPPEWVRVLSDRTPDDELWYVMEGETVVRRVKKELYSGGK